MKNSIKTLVVGLAMALPMASFAEEAKQVAETKPVVKEEVKEVKHETKAEVKNGKEVVEAKAENMQIMLEGAKDANTAEIVKLAKEAGASKASFNSKNHTLTLSGKEFNKEKFTSSLSASLPGVSIKN